MQTYQLVLMVDGEFVTVEGHVDNLIAAAEARGYRLKGRVAHGLGVRTELLGWPKFTGLYGPFWNRDGIRYEDAETYRAMSA